MRNLKSYVLNKESIFSGHIISKRQLMGYEPTGFHSAQFTF